MSRAGRGRAATSPTQNPKEFIVKKIIVILASLAMLVGVVASSQASSESAAATANPNAMPKQMAIPQKAQRVGSLTAEQLKSLERVDARTAATLDKIRTANNGQAQSSALNYNGF